MIIIWWLSRNGTNPTGIGKPPVIKVAVPTPKVRVR